LKRHSSNLLKNIHSIQNEIVISRQTSVNAKNSNAQQIYLLWQQM